MCTGLVPVDPFSGLLRTHVHKTQVWQSLLYPGLLMHHRCAAAPRPSVYQSDSGQVRAKCKNFLLLHFFNHIRLVAHSD